MRVLIAEKPSVAKDIAKALGGFTLSASRMFLSNQKDCIITWAFGHLVEIYHPTVNDINKLPLLPEDKDWQLRVKNNSGCQAQFDNIKDLVNNNKVNEVVNACDAGREGELICRLIYEKIGTDKPLKRMWINSMTKEALVKAYNNLRPASEYEGLNRAAWCRSKSDWIVGLNGSIAATDVMSRKTALAQNIALGRVKSPVVTMVVVRQREIDNFKPELFWEISGTFEVNGSQYKGRWIDYTQFINRQKTKANALKKEENGDDSEEGENDEEKSSLYSFRDKNKALAVINACMQGQSLLPVTNIIENKVLKRITPPNLFDIGSIQTLANKLYKFDTDYTLDLVQELYEKHKAVTYPRTDSDHLPEDYKGECHKILDALAQQKDNRFIFTMAEEAKARIDVVGKHIFDNSKVSDHFAIIPTGVKPHLDSEPLKKIYYLIVRRFKEAFLPSMEYNQTDRYTFIGDIAFKTIGKSIVNLGWQQLGETLDNFKDSNNPNSEQKNNKNSKDGDVTLPDFKDPKDVQVKSVDLDERITTPPKPYTQGILLNAMKHISRSMEGEQKKALKDCGIGTPATRSNIIKELLATETPTGKPKQALLEEVGKGKDLAPTNLAKQIVAFLEECNITALTSAEFTADWEMHLHEVQKSPQKSNEFMDHTNKTVSEFVEKLKKIHNELPTLILKGAKCPSCSSNLLIEPKSIKCENISSCNFSVSRIIGRKNVSENDLQVLINNGETHVIDGFTKKPTTPDEKPKTFSAGLKLVKVDDKYVVKYYYPRDKYDLPCPKCGGELVSTLNGIGCESADCKTMFWKVFLGKTLSDKQQRDLIGSGRTKPISGFKSRSGNQFTASLVWNDIEKQVTLEFENSNSNEEKTTKFKCMKSSCDGTYTKTGVKYVCSDCKSYIFGKIKNSSAFTETQIKKLFKGETIQHSVKTFGLDGTEEGQKNVCVYINKSDGRLIVSDKVDS